MSPDEINKIDIETLLAKTEAFMRKMYYVREDFGLIPRKEHIGTCINYSDLIEMRNDFVNEMITSILRFVYSTSKIKKIIEELKNDGRDYDSAYGMLILRAKEKFRKSSVQGQFSELLLYNLLQHHFKAVPILRKMPITTNPELERNGADAIHIGKIKDNIVIYIGEAKTYDRKKDSFKDAFRDALHDILKHYYKHREELNLYIFEDFIPEELENFVRNYQEGRIHDIEIHLVCMVAYKNDNPINGNSRKEILDNTISSIWANAKQIKHDVFKDVPQHLWPRITYILFPVKEMKELLELFKRKLG